MAGSDERTIRESDAESLIRRGTLERGGGNLDRAESLFRDALRTLEHAGAPDDPALIGTLNTLGQLLVDQGAFEEAESLLTRALALSESAPSADDDELPILLLELSRLYILQSAYDLAERPLLRLLAITEAQGEGRPEVATVLASLAAVRHALGEHTSAEDLYRRALNIRERTLTPNHITTATTMESLAETCAARGRFAEAVSLCTRALSMREMTLGAGDASVRAARKRIADLQLEAPEESRMRTPPRSAPTVKSAAPVDEPPVERKPIVDASPLPAVLIPWAHEFAAVREEIESTSPDVVDDRAPWRNALATALAPRSSTAIAVAAGAVVVLAALGIKSQLGNKPDPNSFVEAEPFNPAAHPETRPVAVAAVPTLAAPAPLDTLATAARRDTIATVSPPVAPRAAPPPRAVARELPRAQVSRPNAPVAQAPRPNVPVAQAPKRANAIAPSASRVGVAPAGRVASPPATPVIDSASVPARAVAAVVEKAPETRGRSESVNAPTSNAPTSPTLIGTAQQPQYPEALRDQQVEGEVVVQFVVDENGRPDISSMTVVRSPHVLLTNAVRTVLPQFRFEPARTAPPQSTPRPETVRYAFTFRAPRR